MVSHYEIEILNKLKGEIMITNKWVNFTIYDLTWNEETLFTQKEFEEMCNDKFITMELDEKGSPKYIWTEKLVFVIQTFIKVGIGNPAMIGLPRNPDWNES